MILLLCRYKAPGEHRHFYHHLSFYIKVPLLDLWVIFTPFPLSIFLFFGVSIFSHFLTHFHVVTHWHPSDLKGRAIREACVCHTLRRRAHLLPEFNNICVLWKVRLYEGHIISPVCFRYWKCVLCVSMCPFGWKNKIRQYRSFRHSNSLSFFWQRVGLFSF